MLMVGRTDQHEVGAGPAHLGTGDHEPEVRGLDMLSSCLQAMVHGGGQAGFIAAQANLDAAGHFFVH
jgi:hypothetical protein